MFGSFTLRYGLLVAFIGATIGLGACGNGDSGSEDSEKSSSLENVAAMAREHANDSTEPSAGAKIAPQRAVASERLPYAEVDENLVYGHFAFPADMIEPLPAVIIVHEWWGLNDNIRAMADRLASEGYIVLAIDLYAGAVADDANSARQMLLSVVENPEAASNNIRQAYEFLSSTAGAPRVGVLGWCVGGGWALDAAIMLPNELDAVVVYYGQVTDDDERLRAITAPILGLFGEQDTGIPVDSVRNFERALARLRKDYEIHIYPDAGHAFANPTGNRYNAEAAEDAWARTLRFLGHNLLAGSSSGS
jgi:carboxymethylenebutenolidase